MGVVGYSGCGLNVEEVTQLIFINSIINLITIMIKLCMKQLVVIYMYIVIKIKLLYMYIVIKIKVLRVKGQLSPNGGQAMA